MLVRIASKIVIPMAVLGFLALAAASLFAPVSAAEGVCKPGQHLDEVIATAIDLHGNVTRVDVRDPQKITEIISEAVALLGTPPAHFPIHTADLIVLLGVEVVGATEKIKAVRIAFFVKGCEIATTGPIPVEKFKDTQPEV